MNVASPTSSSEASSLEAMGFESEKAKMALEAKISMDFDGFLLALMTLRPLRATLRKL